MITMQLQSAPDRRLASEDEDAAMPTTNRTASRTANRTASRTASRTANPTSGIAVARFFMSGDLRAATGISRTHLDFYLREGIVLPTARTESGYLLFDDAERARLELVMQWRSAGVPLKEIRERLGRPAPETTNAPQSPDDDATTTSPTGS